MISDDIKHVDILPYNKKYNYFTQLEKLARYQFAADFIVSKGLKTALDIGCYNGYGCEIMAEKAQSVCGVDINKRFITLAKNYKEKKNIKNIEYLQADLTTQDIPTDQKFDVITCFDTLAYLKDNKTLIEKLYHKLNNDGYLLVSVPFEKFEPLKPDGTSAVAGHVNIYKPTKVKRMFIDAGFEVVDRLGQAISNVFYHLENFLIRKYDYPERKVKSFYSYEKEHMDYFARLMAYPNIRYIEDSYSIFLVLKKNNHFRQS